jgi:uncharacterized Zn finger protein
MEGGVAVNSDNMNDDQAAAKAIESRFNIAALQELAGDKIFARGSDYHDNGQVEITDITRKRVLAKVIGTRVYQTQLTGGGRNFDGSCSCPAFSDWGFCKHLVATALAANGMASGAVDPAGSRIGRLREYLYGKDSRFLTAIILRMAEHAPELLEDVELSAAADAGDDETLKRELKRAITQATRTCGLVQYHKVATGESGLEKDEVHRRAFALLRTQVEASGATARPGWRSPVTLLINLTMAEGLWDEAWHLVRRYGCSEHVLQDLAEQSEKTHPAEALQFHVKRVEALIARGGQGNYGAACELIERVARIRQGLDQAGVHAAWLTDLMTRHKAKRNLIKLLTGMARPARTMNGAA